MRPTLLCGNIINIWVLILILNGYYFSVERVEWNSLFFSPLSGNAKHVWVLVYSNRMNTQTALTLTDRAVSSIYKAVTHTWYRFQVTDGTSERGRIRRDQVDTPQKSGTTRGKADRLLLHPKLQVRIRCRPRRISKEYLVYQYHMLSSRRAYAGVSPKYANNLKLE